MTDRLLTREIDQPAPISTFSTSIRQRLRARTRTRTRTRLQVTVNFLNFRPAHHSVRSFSRARTHLRVSVNFLNFGALPLGSTPDCAYEALTPNQPDQERA